MLRKIEISHKTILFTFLILAGIIFLYQIRDILLILFVSLLIMVILNPIVKKLAKFKIPRSLSVLIVYLLFFSIMIITLAEIIPALIEQTTNFASGLPSLVANLNIPTNILNQISSQIVNKIADVPANIFGLGVSVISNIVTILTVLAFAFYLLMERNKLDDQLSYLLGEKKAKEIGETLNEIELKLGGWARGQLFLMLTVGVLTYAGLMILGIPYALPLAVLAGFFELVPYAGPIISAIPPILIGLGISPLMGLGAASVAFLVQQLENHILVPKVMERSVGVAPIIILLSLAIGFKIAGITGVLISVPVVITLRVLIRRRFLV